VLTAALANPAIKSLDQLVAHLKEKEIEATLKRDAKGLLVGTSFRYQEISVKGTDVVVKAKQLRDHFRPFGREALRTADPVRPSGTGLASTPTGATLATDEAGALLSFEDGPAAGPAVDDAQQNEKELRRKKRRRRHH
jgi:hypothetical protein